MALIQQQDTSLPAEQRYALATASTATDIIAILKREDATTDLLSAVTRRLEHLVSNDPEYKSTIAQESEMSRLVLCSPHLTHPVAEEWKRYNWSLPHEAAIAFIKGFPVSPVGLVMALSDHWRGRDTSFRLKVLKSELCTEEVISSIARDYRVTVARAVAKHPLLTAEVGEHFLTSEDAQSRINVMRHSWVPSETLYLLRDDPNPKVSAAAQKAIRARGLSETDEVDAVMGDEVSLFFLSTTDDEDTLVRIGASANATEEAYRSVARHKGVPRKAVAGNRHAPSDLLEEISVEESSESDYWKFDLHSVLALNPANTFTGVMAIYNRNRWNRDVSVGVVSHPDCPDLMVQDFAKAWAMKIRVAAIQTGRLSNETLDIILRNEHRMRVFALILEHYESRLLESQLRNIHATGNEKVRAKAAAALESRGLNPNEELVD